MTIQLLDNVMSPEAGVQTSPAGFPTGMGANPAGRGGPPPGMRQAPPSAAMAKRLDTLNNKTVYLVDTGFGGSYQFMLQLQKW
ncbi:MAG: hypothetical protein ACYDG5_04815, partial [Dehalococcoidales bacterium]